MNCTVAFFAYNVDYKTSQTVILSLLLFSILALNLFVLGTALAVTATRICPVRKLFLSSYVGNIIGSASLFHNEIKNTKYGMPPLGCRVGVDRYYFLYLGVSINMVILLTNSYVRYKAIVSLQISRGNQDLNSNRSVILKYMVPTWILSMFIASIAVCICISGIPLMWSILFSIMLHRFLSASQNNTAVKKRPASDKRIEDAKCMINTAIIAHSFYLILGVVSTLMSKYLPHNKSVVVTCFWVFWIVAAAMFSVEAKVFLYKTPDARHAICLKLVGVTGRIISPTTVSENTEMTQY